MLSEYWQEEKPMLAKKRHVDQFNSEVDRLRSDVERFEKRLQKLAKISDTKLNSSKANEIHMNEISPTPHNQVTDSAK